MGVPIAANKTCGPTMCLVFLGIEIDPEAHELRLPSDKLTRLQKLLQEWGDRKVCSRKELESLIGLLNHACKVVRSARSLIPPPYDRSVTPLPSSEIPHSVDRGFRSDLA